LTLAVSGGEIPTGLIGSIKSMNVIDSNELSMTSVRKNRTRG
jgi:hypothetical protein